MLFRCVLLTGSSSLVLVTVVFRGVVDASESENRTSLQADAASDCRDFGFDGEEVSAMSSSFEYHSFGSIGACQNVSSAMGY